MCLLVLLLSPPEGVSCQCGPALNQLAKQKGLEMLRAKLGHAIFAQKNHIAALLLIVLLVLFFPHIRNSSTEVKLVSFVNI